MNNRKGDRNRTEAEYIIIIEEGRVWKEKAGKDSNTKSYHGGVLIYCERGHVYN